MKKPMNKAIEPLDDRKIVTRAVLKAAKALGMTNQALSRAMGISASKLDRARGSQGAVLNGKDYEIALLLIRIYRALYAILGGNREQMKHWIATPNRHLHGESPLTQLQSIEGLVLVVRYLDGMRGRI